MTAHRTSRPSWQHDACPSWCVVEHAEHDLPDDRIHDSTNIDVRAVLGPAHARGRPVDLSLVMSRRCGELDDWVLVGEPERDGQFLLLSRDSAARVVGALAALLRDPG